MFDPAIRELASTDENFSTGCVTLPSGDIARRDADPYAFAEVRGAVAETITGGEARAHIDALSHRHFGKDADDPITRDRVIVEVALGRRRSVGL